MVRGLALSALLIGCGSPGASRDPVAPTCPACPTVPSVEFSPCARTSAPAAPCEPMGIREIKQNHGFSCTTVTYSNNVETHCYFLEKACEITRRQHRAARIGTTPCVPAEQAQCFSIVDPLDQKYAYFCVSLDEDCEAVRADEQRRTAGARLGPCRIEE